METFGPNHIRNMVVFSLIELFLFRLYRPIAGSLTEARGQKASIHVCREMLELCQIIHSEGYPITKENPELRVILFGELFNVNFKRMNFFPKSTVISNWTV